MNKIKIPENIAYILDNYFEYSNSHDLFDFKSRLGIKIDYDTPDNFAELAEIIYNWSQLNNQYQDILMAYMNNATSPKNMPELWEILS